MKKQEKEIVRNYAFIHSAGGGRRKNPAKKSFIKLFIYFASAGTTSGIPASFLYRNRKEGKERGRGKIGIITHVRTYMRT